jgi:hemerythrin
MPLARLKSLDPPHKGLRNALSQFSLLSGKTDYSNKESVASLQELGAEVFHLLLDHTQTEDNYILKPLEDKIPGSAEKESAEHLEITAMELNLKKQLDAFDGTQDNEAGHEFYLQFTEFHGLYLKHIAEEDHHTEKLMQSNFTDEELIGHQVVIMQNMDFKTLLLWFKYIVPARRLEENRQVLEAFKANAPEEAFVAVQAIIQSVVSPNDFDSLMKGWI